MSSFTKDTDATVKCSLLENKDYLTEADEEGRVPLHHAALNDDSEMGRALLEAGSDVNAVDGHGNTPLHNSSYHNCPKFTAMLLSKGAKVNIHSKNLDSPLDYASEAGYIEIVKLLIEAGADVNLCGENNWSPLHNAAGISRKIAMEIVELLLAAGANAAVKSGNGQYPYDVAENANVRVRLTEAKATAYAVQSILSEPEKITSTDALGRTALHQAILVEDLVTSRALLLAGARVDAQDLHGNTPLHNASYHNSVPSVTLLLRQSESKLALNMRSCEGDSALDYACSNGHLEVAMLLVSGGADVNAQDSRGWGALHNSCTKLNGKSVELVEFLLENGANPLLLNSDGQKPYDISREKSVRSVLKIKMDSVEADMEFLDGGMEF